MSSCRLLLTRTLATGSGRANDPDHTSGNPSPRQDDGPVTLTVRRRTRRIVSASQNAEADQAAEQTSPTITKILALYCKNYNHANR